MHCAVHVERSSPYTIGGKQGALSANLKSKRRSVDNRASCGPVYAKDAAVKPARFLFSFIVVRLLGYVVFELS